MAGNLTTGGLGSPGGLLVTHGVGTAETDPNAIRAHLYGQGSLTATLTGTATGGGRRGARRYGYTPTTPNVAWATPGDMSAHLHGSSTLTGTLDGPLVIPPWVDQLLDLLMFDLV